jgi:hypothetical protein
MIFTFEKIFLVKRNFVPSEEVNVFVFERLPVVMLFLRLKILSNGGNLRMADGKCGVALLPFEFGMRPGQLIHPL